MSKNLHIRKPPRFRISGVTAAVTTLQEADVLDLSLEGALVEHQDPSQSNPSVPSSARTGSA
jgi:hypothetical protein